MKVPSRSKRICNEISSLFGPEERARTSLLGAALVFLSGPLTGAPSTHGGPGGVCHGEAAQPGAEARVDGQTRDSPPAALPTRAPPNGRSVCALEGRPFGAGAALRVRPSGPWDAPRRLGVASVGPLPVPLGGKVACEARCVVTARTAAPCAPPPALNGGAEAAAAGSRVRPLSRRARTRARGVCVNARVPQRLLQVFSGRFLRDFRPRPEPGPTQNLAIFGESERLAKTP